MLDIRFIRENADLVAEKAKQKGYDVNIATLLKKYEIRNKYLHERENLKQQINEISKKSGPPSQENIARAKTLKQQLSVVKENFRKADDEADPLLRQIPNIFPDDTPIGDETANREEKKWGDTNPKDFEVIDHLTWGEKRELIDFERGAKVAGNKFYFLKGSLVELEMAVFQFGLEMAKKHGFTPMSVPHLVNTRVLEGAGFSARGEEKQIYKVEDEDLNLIATAEIPLTGYHTDEILEEKDLPRKYAGLSPAYRVEGGAYGKYNRGLFRTHQFNKLELYVFSKPEDSEQWHQKMVDLEEEFCQALEIPYRIVRIASRDLGAPAYKKFDIEYYTPVDNSFRELMSCSNVTDYQARRLNVRYRTAEGKTEFVHTLNGTLAATSRIPIAIVENHQQADGTIKVPKVLQPYFGNQETI